MLRKLVRKWLLSLLKKLVQSVATKPGLYANINAKRARIKAGSGEKMRKVGAKGAPTAKAFKQSLKTAKKK
jgi:hypothetical protein